MGKNLVELVNGYVEKSGGIEKIEQAIKSLKGIGDHRGFLSRLACATRPEGAKQLISSAILGNVLAAMMYKSTKKEKKWKTTKG